MRFFRIIKTSLNLEGHIENQCTRLVVASKPENDSQEEHYADKFCTIKDLCGGAGGGGWGGGNSERCLEWGGRGRGVIKEYLLKLLKRRGEGKNYS